MSTAAAASRLSCARALTPSRVALDASSPPPNRGVLAPARRRGRALLAGSPTRALASTPRWNVSSTAISKMSSSRTIVNDHYSFGPLDIPRSQVFAETPLSYGIVNLKPVVPGHVLVVTRRIIKRFESLTEDELVDVWTLAKKVGSALEKHHGATSLTYAIQDGPSAGQTIPHVHIHVLPRRDGDFENNDEVYDAVDASERAIGGGGERLNLDAERVIRTPEEMAAEAATIRKLLFNNGVNPNAR